MGKPMKMAPKSTISETMPHHSGLSHSVVTRPSSCRQQDVLSEGESRSARAAGQWRSFRLLRGIRPAIGLHGVEALQHLRQALDQEQQASERDHELERPGCRHQRAGDEAFVLSEALAEEAPAE